MAKKTASASASDLPNFGAMLADAGVADNTPKAKKDNTVRFTLKNWMRIKRLSAMKWAWKTLAAAIETNETAAKADARDEYFIPMGAKLRAAPGNFKMETKGHEVGFQLKKRSSASGLDEDEQKLCIKHGIPIEEKIIIQAGLMINPEHHTQAVFALLQKALTLVPELPRDLIIPQKKKATMITSDNALSVMFGLKEDAIRVLYSVVGVSAMTYGAAPVNKEDFDEISDLLFPEPEKTEA
jgi:hypothetical protein